MENDYYHDFSRLFEMAESDVNVIRGSTGGVAQPLERSVEDDAPRVGVSGLSRSRRGLFHYDRAKGLSDADLRFTVSKSDRLSDQKAAERLQKIHDSYGLVRQEEGIYYAFDTAFFLCYAINGISVLLPSDRVEFTVHGSKYDFATAHTILGVDGRRFFRTFANEVVQACHDLYDNCDYSDPDQVHLRDLMIQLADDRNVSRAPWLVADCAEAATILDASERKMVALSKMTVIGNTPNAVDRRRVGQPVRSLDNYDSANSEAVSGAQDIHQPSVQYHS